jgi:hypothetical protein
MCQNLTRSCMHVGWGQSFLITSLAVAMSRHAQHTIWGLQCLCRYKTTTKYTYRNPQNVNLALQLAGFWVTFYSIWASASPRTDMKKRTLVPQNAYHGWLFADYSTVLLYTTMDGFLYKGMVAHARLSRIKLWPHLCAALKWGHTCSLISLLYSGSKTWIVFSFRPTVKFLT